MTVENPPIDQTKKKDAPQLSRRGFFIAGHIFTPGVQ